MRLFSLNDVCGYDKILMKTKRVTYLLVILHWKDYFEFHIFKLYKFYYFNNI